MSKVFPILFISALLVFTSCKKQQLSNVLCNGNGSNSLWPLAVGDAWFYDDGTSVFIGGAIGNKYVYCYGNYRDTLIVQENGDIYYKYQTIGNDVYQQYLLLPANYTLGETWTTSISPDYTETVSIGVSPSNIQGANCDYQNCLLVVSELHGTNGYNQTEASVYKIGLGSVFFDANNQHEATLDSVILR